MGIFKRLFGRSQSRGEMFVLGLDGVSFSLLNSEQGRQLMPTLAELLDRGVLGRMRSVLPTVSSVAWATYATGANPGKHGIYGFVDRHPDPFNVLIPTARDLKALTLWEHLSRFQLKLGVMGVPLTYPPKPINGFMVGCFLSPELASATYPVDLAPRLMEMDYRLDVDSSLAREDMEAFLADLDQTLSRRFSACFQLMKSEPWDFFQLNIIATDRINHFLWGAWQEGHETLAEQFLAFYRRLDGYLGELLENLPRGCGLVIMSDHGFTRSQGQVYLNRWLEENGYLLMGRGKRELRNMHPESRAYSLAPGRVYLNLQGREEHGGVERGRPYEDLRDELSHRLNGLCDPESDTPLVQRVHKREEIYSGAHLGRAPDLVVEPAVGFDFRADLNSRGLVGQGETSGVHTYDDAFFFIQGMADEAWPPDFSLMDAAPTILQLMELPVPEGMDGHPLP